MISPNSPDVVEAFLTPKKRKILNRALTHLVSILDKPKKAKELFNISNSTASKHKKVIEEMLDDFNVR